MKKLFLVVLILLNITIPMFANDIENFNLNNSINSIANDGDIANVLNNLPLASEYNEYKNFDINKLPDGMFYKLNFNCKYYLKNENYELKTIKHEYGGIVISYNNDLIDLGILDESCIEYIHTSSNSSLYLIREKEKFYILVDKMFYNDMKYYRLYSLTNSKIELVEKSCGRIDFVGYNYIIGYTDLGMIGYQRCEFKKIFRNGKFELDGEYKVVASEQRFPIQHFYTLTNDLEYEECNVETGQYNGKILKAGTKIRSLATDYKTYIKIETEDGKIGKIKVDEIREKDSITKDFYVNNQFFMNYYFLDGSKYSYQVFSQMPAY